MQDHPQTSPGTLNHKAMPHMNEPEKPTAPETYEGPLSPAGVAALKFAVVGMGVLIIIGLLVVIGRIIYLAATPKAERQAAQPALTADAQVSLPRDARPIRTSTDGSRLSILYQKTDSTFGVVIVDLRTGQTLSRVSIGSDEQTPGQKTK